jgi:glycosyltransferase involved in cell wall biosynthesis
MTDKLLSVLIPVYNEIATIARVADVVAVTLPGVPKEIVIVDDGSNDGTRDWLTSRFTLDGPTTIAEGVTVRVVFHPRNRGKGGAIQTAMATATGDVLVIQDADLEYDPNDWIRMYDLIAVKQVADVVYGSRFYGLPHRSLYYHHFLANRLISGLFNVLYNQTLTDIEVCYKMFTREVLKTLRLDCDDFGIEVQLSAQIARARSWRIYEMAVHYYGRTYDEGKKINWRDGVKAIWYLFKYRFA